MRDDNSIVFLNRDVMSGVALSNSGKSLGYEIIRAPDTAAFVEALTHSNGQIALGIIDMNSEIDWKLVASTIESADKAPPIIGFGPHVDIDGRRTAKAAGLVRIFSNREFHRDMATIIDRYAESNGDRHLD